MLNSKGFDLWANGYDQTAGVLDEADRYPFAGYKRILGSIFQRIMTRPHPRVLDIGLGTGTLTARLYEEGCEIYGQDFSPQMLRIASAKMPDAHLYPGDFAQGLAAPLLDREYDFIVSTYALHHLTDPQKEALLHRLLGLLKADGQLLIGDVAFGTRDELNRFRQEAGEDWDAEEIYFAADEWKRVFPQLRFEPFSPCSGILTLSRHHV